MTGTKLKVTVLYDLWEEEPVEVQEEVPAPRKRKGPEETQEEAGKAGPRRDLRSPGEARPSSRRITFSTAARNLCSDSPNAAPTSSSTSPNPMPATTPRRCTSPHSSICSISPTPAPDRTPPFSPRTNPSPRRCSRFTAFSRPTSPPPIAATSTTPTTSRSRSSSSPPPKMDPSASMPPPSSTA